MKKVIDELTLSTDAAAPAAAQPQCPDGQQSQSSIRWNDSPTVRSGAAPARSILRVRIRRLPRRHRRHLSGSALSEPRLGQASGQPNQPWRAAATALSAAATLRPAALWSAALRWPAWSASAICPAALRRASCSYPPVPSHGAQKAGVPVTRSPGSTLRIRINQGLDSKHAQPGMSFDGVVLNDVVADGAVAIPRGAAVQGNCSRRQVLRIPGRPW